MLGLQLTHVINGIHIKGYPKPFVLYQVIYLCFPSLSAFPSTGMHFKMICMCNLIDENILKWLSPTCLGISVSDWWYLVIEPMLLWIFKIVSIQVVANITSVLFNVTFPPFSCGLLMQRHTWLFNPYKMCDICCYRLVWRLVCCWAPGSASVINHYIKYVKIYFTV